jgi:hypothetical protein
MPIFFGVLIAGVFVTHRVRYPRAIRSPLNRSSD